MMAVSVSTVTELLESWREGDPSALTRLTPLIYSELRRIAHRYTQREAQGHTLQTTALVNEAYLRLAKQEKANWQDHNHFFAATAQVMRHILIDHARRRRYFKHGGDLQRVPLDDAVQISAQRADELIALDEALNELRAPEARRQAVGGSRCAGGLCWAEPAMVLGVSEMRGRREWRAAKAWL